MGTKKQVDKALPIPPDNIKEAWDMYVQHRKELRCPLTPTGGKLLLKRLMSVPPAVAIAALEQSITMGWRGVFFDSTTRAPGLFDGRKEIDTLLQ